MVPADEVLLLADIWPHYRWGAGSTAIDRRMLYHVPSGKYGNLERGKPATDTDIAYEEVNCVCWALQRARDVAANRGNAFWQDLLPIVDKKSDELNDRIRVSIRNT